MYPSMLLYHVNKQDVESKSAVKGPHRLCNVRYDVGKVFIRLNVALPQSAASRQAHKGELRHFQRQKLIGASVSLLMWVTRDTDMLSSEARSPFSQRNYRLSDSC